MPASPPLTSIRSRRGVFESDHDDDDASSDFSGASFSGGHGNSNSTIVMGQVVVVRVGKGSGQIGTVRRSGHGFYAVALDSGEEIMKRASGTLPQSLSWAFPPICSRV
jgi:hypothetical protein